MSVDVEITCACPGTPHEADTVSLRERLGLAAGISIQKLIIEANAGRPDEAEITGRLAEAYLLHGVESWTLTDINNQPLPVNPLTISARLLSDFTLASPVAEKADDLYMTAVLLPLVERAKKSSPITPTDGSTSPPRPGTSPPRKRSKRSSTSTTPTASTEETSSGPAGAYN